MKTNFVDLFLGVILKYTYICIYKIIFYQGEREREREREREGEREREREREREKE